MSKNPLIKVPHSRKMNIKLKAIITTENCASIGFTPCITKQANVAINTEWWEQKFGSFSSLTYSNIVFFWQVGFTKRHTLVASPKLHG